MFWRSSHFRNLHHIICWSARLGHVMAAKSESPGRRYCWVLFSLFLKSTGPRVWWKIQKSTYSSRDETCWFEGTGGHWSLLAQTKNSLKNLSPNGQIWSCTESSNSTLNGCKMWGTRLVKSPMVTTTGLVVTWLAATYSDCSTKTLYNLWRRVPLCFARLWALDTWLNKGFQLRTVSLAMASTKLLQTASHLAESEGWYLEDHSS